MGLASAGYKILLVVHILSAIVGFGPLMLNGLYGAEAKKRQGPGGLAIGEANFHVTEFAEKIVYTVPIWGIGLVFMSDGVWAFKQIWVGLAIVLYLVATAISHAVMFPSSKRMNALAAALVAAGPPPAGATGRPPQVDEMEALGKKLGAGGGVLALILVAILSLMVFKPGF